MLIYYILIAVVLAIGLFGHFYMKDKKWFKILYFFIVGISLVFIAGFRYGIGFDYHVYMKIYDDILGNSVADLLSKPGFRFELGFIYFVKWVQALLEPSGSIVILISALVIAGLLTGIKKLFAKEFSLVYSAGVFLTAGVFLFISRQLLGVLAEGQIFYLISAGVLTTIALSIIYYYSELDFVSLLFFISFGFFYSIMNLLRYSFSGIIIMMCLPFLLNSKMDYEKENRSFKAIKNDLLTNFLPYLLVVLLSASFHKSALIMIPVYFIAKLPINKITIALAAVGSTVLFLFAKPLAQVFSNVFFDGNYEISGSSVLVDKAGIGFVFTPLVLFVACIFFYDKLMKRNKNLKFLIIFAFISLVFNVFAAFFVFMATRLTLFFEVFNVILMAEFVQIFLFEEEAVAELAEDEKKQNKAQAARERAKEKAVEKSKKDSKANYNFAITLVLVFGVSLQIAMQKNGAHDVFPYMSQLSSLTAMTNMGWPGGDNARNSYILQQNDLGQYLMAANDDRYMVVIVSSGDAYNSYMRHSPFEPMRKYGIDIDEFLERPYLSSIFIASGENLLYENVSEHSLDEKFELEGFSFKLTSSSRINGTYGAIAIDGESYISTSEQGLHIVVYDKLLGQVIDSLSFGCNGVMEVPTREDG